MKCELCGKDFSYDMLSRGQFGRHLSYTHNITTKQYYDTYLKKENEGICKICGKATAFYSVLRGYTSYCSKKCTQLDPEIQHKAKEKMKQTNLKKYGVACTFSRPEINKKAIKNNQSKEAKQKRQNTNLKKYGVDNPLKSKNIQDKIKQTNLDKYGVECTFSSNEIQNKIKQTNLKKYGFEIATKNNKVKEKMKTSYIDNNGGMGFASTTAMQKYHETMKNKYGVENASQSPEIQEKIQNTNKLRYGGCGYQSPKTKETNLLRYGVEIPNLYGSKQFQNAMLKKYGKCHFGIKHYLYDNVFFDSSWELAFYIYCKDAGINICREPFPIEYYNKDNVLCKYYPDFQLEDTRFEDNHVLIEIKGGHLINKNMQLLDYTTKEIDYEKTQCLIDNHVYIITGEDIKSFLQYCINKFNDKNWHKQFIYHKDKGEQENNE